MTVRRGLFVLAITAFLSSGLACFAEDWDVSTARNTLLNPAQGTFDARAYEVMSLSGTGTGEEKAFKKTSLLPGVTDRDLHAYLGYATVLLAGVTAVSSGSKHFHWGAAYATAGTAALTVTTGALAHGRRFTLEDGLFTQDNTHILLGTIGAAACIAAVFMADSDGGGGHAGTGIFGGAAMALSVVTIRW
jgi:hypothetical protein